MTDEFCYYIRFHGIREIIQDFDDTDNNQSSDMMNPENGIDYINCYDCFTSKICKIPLSLLEINLSEFILKFI